MADDSKVLAVTTKAIREFIVSAAQNVIIVDGKRYRASRPMNVTNARSGKFVEYRYWFNSCRPVPVSDCAIQLYLVTIVDGVEKLRPSVHAVRFTEKDSIVWE